MDMLKKYSGSAKVFFPKFSRQEVINKIKKCTVELRGKLGLESVILFGSYARENYTVASDIDILVIFDDEKVSEDKVYKCLMKSIQLPRVELHLIPKKDLKTYEASKWMKTIEKEGIKIL
ncbi:nucleotidyltransferase domain-containing protein [Candidatus Bathyarchaeota archaeon]|nr:nucleotidyltransferase domain-containing protein [Candidatus Bathyarchaeota archaeon]